MKLSEALGVLSKSSPFSVATQSDRPKDELDELKDYLYIEQDIERRFRELLEQSKPNQVFFLCGSSGDGKSEILTRAYHEFKDRVEFHLDATHGFEPHQTAVEALDQVFDKFKQSNLPLAIGINVGMMSNFAAAGSDRHQDVKVSIINFVTEAKEDPTRTHVFVDFESFPKFEFDGEKTWNANFSSALMRRLTQTTSSNPFRAILKTQPRTEHERRVKSNFILFARPEVQRHINGLLFRARLEFDQFLTARALLDFIYHIITGPEALVDNLFLATDNDLARKIVEFDPAECHSKRLDRFRLRPYSSELQSFIESARQHGLYIHPKRSPEPKTLLRFFALCKDVDIGNNFHHQFRPDFERAEGAFDRYARVWMMHADKEIFRENRAETIKFYTTEFIPAVRAYANRRAPWLTKNQFYLQELNGVIVSSHFELKQPTDLPGGRRVHSSHFTATLLAAGHPESLQISLPLFNLLTEIRNGYRPTRYDKNTTVMLDDFVARLSKHATTSRKLLFTHPNAAAVEVERLDEDFFQVEMI